MSEILQQLRLPFHPTSITWKPGAVAKDGTKALAMAYADLRAYQNRLDEVCGMDWSATYTPWGDRIICHLTICDVTRSSTGEPDAQSERSEIAGTATEAQAFKRACSMFGLGRYLYNLPSLWAEYDKERKQFTEAGKSRLLNVISLHYSKSLAAQAEQPIEPTPETSASSVEPLASEPQSTEPPPAAQADRQTDDLKVKALSDFNDLGVEMYGAQWDKVCAHNVDRVSGGQLTDSGQLSAEQIGKLIEGMKSLQRQRAKQGAGTKAPALAVK